MRRVPGRVRKVSIDSAFVEINDEVIDNVPLLP
jgi:hypothetical protein